MKDIKIIMPEKEINVQFEELPHQSEVGPYVKIKLNAEGIKKLNQFNIYSTAQFKNKLKELFGLTDDDFKSLGRWDRKNTKDIKVLVDNEPQIRL